MTGKVVSVPDGVSAGATSLFFQGFTTPELCDAIERLLDDRQIKLQVDSADDALGFTRMLQKRGLRVETYNDSRDGRSRIQKLRHAVAQAIEGIDGHGPSRLDALALSLAAVLEEDVAQYGGPS